MRIIAGKFRGRPLLAPKGEATRPTSDRVKESVFNIVAGYGVMVDANVLDVFAGSGGLGFEALSRGATRCVFIDRAAAAIQVLQKNAAKLGLTIEAGQCNTASPGRVERGETDSSGGYSSQVQIEQGTASAVLQRLAGQTFDVVFADPPYPMSETELTDVLQHICPLLTPESIIVLERSARSPAPHCPAQLEVFRTKTFGETAVYFIELR